MYATSSPEDINTLLSTELSMTTTALKAHPKVYCIWNHRQWCLERVPDGPGKEGADLQGWKKANWDRELSVIDKMLDADARNCLFLKLFVLELGLTPQFHSSCLELPKICFDQHAIPKDRRIGAGIHHTKDRGQLLQLQCLAPAVQTLHFVMG